MKKSFLLSVCVALLFMSCSNTKETPSGYKFTVIKKGDGVASKQGQILVLNFLFKDGKDSVWNDSRKSVFPTMIMVQDSIPGNDPILEVFRMLTKGDSVTVKLPAKTLFEKTFQSQIPPGVDSTSQFTFEIGVIDILSEDQARQMQSDIVAKQNEKAMLAEAEQHAKDTSIIAVHLKEKAIKAQKTRSGISYVVNKTGKGEYAKAGQTVRINYTGYLLDGTCFDSSIESVARVNNVYNEMRAPYGPIEFVLGAQQVIPGWEEAIGLMNKGASMTVYIPSTMAYGPRRRSEIIGENSILKFEMEVVDIK